jgi:hypothetical protein
MPSFDFSPAIFSSRFSFFLSRFSHLIAQPANDPRSIESYSWITSCPVNGYASPATKSTGNKNGQADGNRTLIEKIAKTNIVCATGHMGCEYAIHNPMHSNAMPATNREALFKTAFLWWHRSQNVLQTGSIHKWLSRRFHDFLPKTIAVTTYPKAKPAE